MLTFYVFQFEENIDVPIQETGQLTVREVKERVIETINNSSKWQIEGNYSDVAFIALNKGDDAYQELEKSALYLSGSITNLEIFNKSLDEFSDRILIANKNLSNAFIQDISLDQKFTHIIQWEKNIANISEDITSISKKNKFDVSKTYLAVLNMLLTKFLPAYMPQQIEVVVSFGKFSNFNVDLDLTQVFEMLFVRGANKNKHYLIISKKIADKIIDSAQKLPAANPFFCEAKIDTLSFLYHWSIAYAKNREKLQSRINEMISIIDIIPNLDKVVLRGCSTAGVIDNPILYDPKEIKIVSSKKNIENEPLEYSDFLFQQINKDGHVKTIVKYLDLNNQIVVKELPNIPINGSGNKLSSGVELALAISSKTNNLPLLIFKSKDMTNLLTNIRSEWLEKKSIISPEHKNIIKATIKQTKTFKVTKFPETFSLASELEKKLEERGRKIAIKSYATPYEAFPSGTMGSDAHGHHHLPKGLKK